MSILMNDIMGEYQYIERLCAVSSDPILSGFDNALARQALHELGNRQAELTHLLERKNGFYAFESALHVFPFASANIFEGQDLIHWNSPDLWKGAYGSVLDEHICFAEDIFGYQFCIAHSGVSRFDPETGNLEPFSDTLEDWASLVLRDVNIQTGYPVAHSWQKVNGPIGRGNRLVPIYPLISSEGTYDISNFYEVNALKGLLSRADFASQIRDVPDGQAIKIVAKNVRNDSSGS